MVKLEEDLVYIGVGSNLGDRLEYIKQAIVELNKSGVKVIRTASIYESEPWGFESENAFLNTVFEVQTEQDPFTLLTTLKNVEKKIGRVQKKSTEYESRVVDLDILLYKDQKINTSELQVPHVYLPDRQFVVIPLLELCSEMHFHCLPVQLKQLKEQNWEGAKPVIIYNALLVNE